MTDDRKGYWPDGLPVSDAEKKLLDKTPDASREARLQVLQQQLAQLPDTEALTRAKLSLEIAGLLLDLDRGPESWDHSRPVFEVLIEEKAFEDAALAGQYIYLADQHDALVAIGHAAWLAVSYPIDPNLTANVLAHIIDETPDDSDGAAVAAATAHYVADLRGDSKNGEELKLFTGAMLARVARRHSDINTQTEFDEWVARLELDQPDKFLVRLRNVVDVLVQEDWWLDRGQLRRAFTS